MILNNQFLFVVICLSFLGGAFVIHSLSFSYIYIQKILIISIVLLGLVSRMRLSILSLKFGIFLILYLLFALISSFLLSKNIVYSLASIQSLLTIVLTYLWVSSMNFNYAQLRKFRSLAYLIIVVQIFFSLYKYSFYGINEQWFIGTMSHSAGQLSLLFPAIAIPLMFFLMKREVKLMSYILVFFLFLFAIIGEKRAAVFILPIIILASYIFILSDELKPKNVSNKFVLFAILFGLVSLGIYLISSLNSLQVERGNVNYLYIFEYAWNYLNMSCVDDLYYETLQGLCSDMDTVRNIHYGRFKLTLLAFDLVFSSDIKTLLFGLGYGAVTPSELLGNSRDILYEVTRLRGSLSGFCHALIETGLFGAGLISSFFLIIFIKLKIGIKKLKSKNAVKWYKMLMVILGVFCFDFFFYSTVLFRAMPLPIIFGGLLASIIIVKKIDQNNPGSI